MVMMEVGEQDQDAISAQFGGEESRIPNLGSFVGLTSSHALQK